MSRQHGFCRPNQGNNARGSTIAIQMGFLMALSMPASAPILVAEGDPIGLLLTLSVLTELGLDGQVTIVGDGEQVLDYLYCRGAFQLRAGGHPNVIFLDLKMPKLTGLEVLRLIMSDDALQLIPKVVFASSSDESEIISAYRLGANAYVVKPIDIVEFRQAVREAGRFWGFRNTPPPRLISPAG